MKSKYYKILSISTMILTIASMPSYALSSKPEIGPGFPGSESVVVSEVETELNNEKFSLAEYSKTIFPAETYNELDEYVYNAFKAYENNPGIDNSCGNKDLRYASGDRYHANMIFDMVEYAYGFTPYITSNIYSYQRNGQLHHSTAEFRDTFDYDIAIEDYVRTVNKAKTIAASLKRDTAMDTVNAISKWVKQNLHYITQEERSNNYKNGFCNYFNAYDGYGVNCTGYAMVFYQLCRMNSIPVTIEPVGIVGNTSVGHALNTVTIDGITYWIDPQLGKLETKLDDSYIDAKTYLK